MLLRSVASTSHCCKNRSVPTSCRRHAGSLCPQLHKNACARHLRETVCRLSCAIRPSCFGSIAKRAAFAIPFLEKVAAQSPTDPPPPVNCHAREPVSVCEANCQGPCTCQPVMRGGGWVRKRVRPDCIPWPSRATLPQAGEEGRRAAGGEGGVDAAHQPGLGDCGLRFSIQPFSAFFWFSPSLWFSVTFEFACRSPLL